MSDRPEYVHAMTKAHHEAMRDYAPPGTAGHLAWESLTVIQQAHELIAMDAAFDVYVDRVTPKINAIFDDAAPRS